MSNTTTLREIGGRVRDLSVRTSLTMCGWRPVTDIDWVLEWIAVNYLMGVWAGQLSSGLSFPPSYVTVRSQIFLSLSLLQQHVA